MKASSSLVLSVEKHLPVDSAVISWVILYLRTAENSNTFDPLGKDSDPITESRVQGVVP